VLQPGAPPAKVAAQKRAHVMREIVETLIFIAIVFVIAQFGIGSFTVSDSSMSPQLKPGQIVVVYKWAYAFAGPSRGDVVVYHNPTNLSQVLAARVIGVPGDTIAISPSTVSVNGVVLNEPYITVTPGTNPNGEGVGTFKLGPNDYYVLNDSRLSSSDSRTFGTIPRSDIIGQASLVFWPVRDLHRISTYPDTYQHVSH
jgi:signal peptidase I